MPLIQAFATPVRWATAHLAQGPPVALSVQPMHTDQPLWIVFSAHLTPLPTAQGARASMESMGTAPTVCHACQAPTV